MLGIKVLLATAAFCAVLLAVMMLWNMESLSCGTETAKGMITVFTITAVALTREASLITKDYEQ